MVDQNRVKQFETRLPKLERKIKRNRLVKTLTNKLTWILTLIIVLMYFSYWFGSTYEPQNIIKSFKLEFQLPFVLRSNSKQTVKTPQKMALHEDILPKINGSAILNGKLVNGEVQAGMDFETQIEVAYDTVWFHESNRGTDKTGLNGKCIDNNKINEIGFAVHDPILFCFANRTEQKATFKLWLTNRLNHIKTPYCNTINECLLSYSNQAYGL